MIVIVYTTKYRLGGQKFERVAQTMKNELSKNHKAILCQPIESKKDLKAIFHNIKGSEKSIKEFHFIGHSGMYGPMYGTVKYPEQFSPYEWRNLEIPFDKNAKAYFHCCRSARWFANFFANTFNVETFGYHWYTTFSQSKSVFKRDNDQSKPLYSVGCKGRKSHGYSASFKKYIGKQPCEEMKSFSPKNEKEDRTYNKVAKLYNDVFTDIKVREDEWNWIKNNLPANLNTVLDIGCGNGALLKELSPNLNKGIGIDLSENILDQARLLNKENNNLEFKPIKGPSIPLEDNSVDFVISMLSFRYLDWDPLFEEVNRVLKPGGSMIILDMVAVPPKWNEYPKLLSSKLKHYKHRKKYPKYWSALSKLTSQPDWKVMLKYNPIRSEHEMKWYLESRFEGKKMEKINIGYNSSIVAFNTGDFSKIKNLKLSYP